MLKEKSERKREFIRIYQFHSFDKLCHVPVKTFYCFDGTYIQYDSDNDIYFKIHSAEEHLEKMKTHFLDIIEELERTRSS